MCLITLKNALILAVIVSKKVRHPFKKTLILDTGERAEQFFRAIWDKELMTKQEQVWILFVNDNCQPIEWKCIHTGGSNQTFIDIKLIMSLAVKCEAAGLFIAHNHPSGRLSPSAHDKVMTEKLRHVCKIMDIELHDHIILTKRSYLSFDGEGLLVDE